MSAWTHGSEADKARGVMLGNNLTYAMLDALGKEIVTGGYDDQPFPTEAELARRHDVSRSVTREAVKMLTAKGLLTARPRKGTTVRPPSRWNLFDPDVLRWLLERKFSLELLRQFSELRIAIEPAAAALAARASDAEGRAAIGAGYARMVAAEAGNDDPLEADIAFHIAILEASANPFYQQFRDVVPWAQALVETAPDRMLWGSDWPHVAVPRMPDTGALRNQLALWAPDPDTRARILVDNPARLYDFR